MKKLTAAVLACALLASAPGIAFAGCAAHQVTASTPATIVDGTGSTAAPPMTPAPAAPSGS